MTTFPSYQRMLESARETYHNHGFEKLFRLGTEYVLIRSALTSTWTKKLYWNIAPSYYRLQYSTDFDREPAATDPFKIETVRPSRIERFTRRCYPPWWQRAELFGSIEDGNWDRRPHEEAPTHGGPPEYLFIGETIEETLLYQALEHHFDEGVPWTKTQFVDEVLSLLEDGVEFVWHDCRTRSDVLERCERLDEIYRSIKRDGLLSYTERTDPREREGNFIDAIEREIIADIGRDGELLLVSGKHRLYMAQILGLNAAPVAFLVRHADWMRTRRSVLTGDTEPNGHPDLRDLSGECAKIRGGGLT